MKSRYILHSAFYIVICIILFSSCASRKLPVSRFTHFSEPATFNGTYLNADNRLANLFNLKGDITDFVTITYNPENKDRLTLSYYTENGLQHTDVKGKLKENYFQIYFENKRIYIPILYTVVNVDRLRIGSSQEADLLIYHWEEAWGMMLLFAGGSGSDEYAYTDKKFDYSQANFLIPFTENGKWGFMDNTKKTVIEAKYDFVRLYKEGIARVKLNGKWGLINMEGEVVADFRYDKIGSPWQGMFRIHSDDKIGYANIKGEEIIPPVYDQIGYFGSYNNEQIAITRQGDKYGYATREGVLCPPIFEKANYFTSSIGVFIDNTIPYGKVKYKGESYLVDKVGYMYRYKTKLGRLTIFEETKIKTSELAE